jgi:hypothetical protein
VLRTILISLWLPLLFAACEPPPDAEAQSPVSFQSPKIVGEGDLEGRYFVSGPIGEGDLVRDSTHFYVWLEGSAAAELYQRMPASPVPQLCEDGSAWVKHSRALACTADADSTGYRCYVAIDVPAETLAVGVSC